MKLEGRTKAKQGGDRTTTDDTVGDGDAREGRAIGAEYDYTASRFTHVRPHSETK
jgi:hypothetical protein